jgi:hypothetical protein
MILGLPLWGVDAIHYSGMALYKICTLVLNVAPYIAVRVIMITLALTLQ